YAETFDSGRSALLFSLKAAGIGEGDEVLLQAYTCVVVVNAIEWTGALPIYADIKADFTMDPSDCEKKITPKTKAIIIQHTFGNPSDMEKLLALSKKYSLFVIEDCAHSLGGTANGALTGTMGDVGMFSFGSDKVVSCVRGGAVITRRKDIAERLSAFHGQLPAMPMLFLLRHLAHFPIFLIGKALYPYGIGKLLLLIAKKLRCTSRIIEESEKHGKQTLGYPTQLPNALAEILLEELAHLKEKNAATQAVASEYRKLLKDMPLPELSPDCVYLRFPLLVEHPERMRRAAKKEGILLGDWYATVIAPADIEMAKMQYNEGSCPVAESAASRSVNLPTQGPLTEHDINQVAKAVRLAMKPYA
ncbi:MAG: aminotransferase class I/II-fold pyridoxal phosphate-dependent enzyme, partial [Patescibacteria group bacterium]